MREAAVHFDTGLSWVDVEDDFSRARRRQVLARLAGWLRRKPDVNRILSFDEATAALGRRGDRAGAHMLADAEVGVIGPHRPPEADAWPHQDLVQARSQIQAPSTATCGPAGAQQSPGGNRDHWAWLFGSPAELASARVLM